MKHSEDGGIWMQISGFESQRGCSFDLWPWVSYLLSLSFRVLIHKNEDNDAHLKDLCRNTASEGMST